jgi:hypothetical protein
MDKIVRSDHRFSLIVWCFRAEDGRHQAMEWFYVQQKDAIDAWTKWMWSKRCVYMCLSRVNSIGIKDDDRRNVLMEWNMPDV